jgi:uncharacterized protein (TIGR04255 family)
MSVLFKKAPLMEIVAELKWPTNGALFFQPSAGQLVPSNAISDTESFYQTFSIEMAKAGFGMSERLVPPGFHPAPGSVAIRFKETPSEQARSNLFQVGPGVFTANALPPYSSWLTFGPVVEQGVEILLKSRSPSEKDLPFLGQTLRYINSFNESLIGAMTAYEFARNVLGLGLQLPESISKHVNQSGRFDTNLNFNIPIDEETSLIIAIADGLVQNEKTVLFDMTVSNSTVPVVASPEEIMQRFLKYRGIIHDIFTSTTVKLHQKMEAS